MVEYLLILKLLGLVLSVICVKVCINFLSYYLICKDYSTQRSNFLVYAPDWWTLLYSVEILDIKRYIDQDHVQFHLAKGEDREEVLLYEECVSWNLLWDTKYKSNHRNVYCRLEDDWFIPVPLHEHINERCLEYNETYMTNKIIETFEQVEDEDDEC